ncbi:MAG: lipoyl synthase [Bacteroidales bacterium]|nr:lipoyl synthase [Bacteroidales bacterium]
MDYSSQRKPDWLKTSLRRDDRYYETARLLKRKKMHTICTSGHCPNIGECWAAGTATFMILGDICTRNCRFCNTKTGNPLPVDMEESRRLAETVHEMKLRHCVITSVDRDDLHDGGAAHWATTIEEVRKLNPDAGIEVLIPDFSGDKDAIAMIINARPDVCGHNLETVERLTPFIRSKASYRRSLEVIRILSSAGLRTKSGIMLGLGETEDEILKTMDDLLDAGCRILTLGQYLQPSPKHAEVVAWYEPRLFDNYRRIALEKGFQFAECGPLVRSSYHAENHSVK